MPIIKCTDCNSDVSDVAPACPNCGKPIANAQIRSVGVLLGVGIFFLPIIFAWFTLRKGHTTKAKVIAFCWLIFPFVLGILASNQNSTTKNYSSSTSNSSSSTSSPATPTITFPNDEIEFIKANLGARDAYRSASNEMAKGGTRAVRKTNICSALSGFSISNWVGSIDKLGSNSDGKGVLSIELTDDVVIKTWNNALSDIMDNTLIDPGSSLFSNVSALKEGDTVKISGSFIQSDTDCVKESSMGLSGSMTAPEWIFRFSAVEKLKN